MDTSGDAAEQVVKLSLEGFEVAARLTGSAAKNIALLLIAALKEEGKTQGKARLTNMIRSGKELKVFSVPQKDLKKFTEHAKKYGVLYCVLREKFNKDENAPVDIIARAEDASKIQRIVDKFEIGKVDKGAILADAQRDVAERESREKEKPEKTQGEMIVEEAMGQPTHKEKAAPENPSTAKTDKDPLSRQDLKRNDAGADKGGFVRQSDKPSVKEKLDRYKAAARTEKKTERKNPEKETVKSSKKPTQTKHKHPKKKKRTKVR